MESVILKTPISLGRLWRKRRWSLSRKNSLNIMLRMTQMILARYAMAQTNQNGRIAWFLVGVLAGANVVVWILVIF